MIFIYAVLICLILYNIRIPQKQLVPLAHRYGSNNLNHANTTAIRGICALCVYFHHVGSEFGGRLTDVIFLNFGMIAVGMYFFLSAYGLVTQYRIQGRKYLKKILFKKIPKIYLWLVVTNLAYLLIFEINAFSENTSMTLLRLFALEWTQRPNSYSWFLYSIIVVYFIFVAVYACESFIKNKHVITAIMAIMPILFGVILYVLTKLTGLWLISYYRGVHLFSLGILYASYKDKIDDFLAKYDRWVAVASLFICVVSVRYWYEEVIPIPYCVLTVILCEHFSLSNPFVNFLGKISLFVYIIHNMMIRLLDSLRETHYLFVLLTLLSSLLTATALYYIDVAISLAFNKLKSRKKACHQA